MIMSESKKTHNAQDQRPRTKEAIATLDGWQARGGYHSALDDDAATLRGLLERHGGGE